MSITLDLPAETESRFRLEARAHGQNVKEYLEQYLAPLPQLTGADYGRLLSIPPTEEEIRNRLAVLHEISMQDDDEGDPDWDVLKAIKENPIQLREVVLPDDDEDE